MPLSRRAVTAALIAITAFALSSCAPTKPPSRPSDARNPSIAYKPLVTIRNNSYRNIVLGLRGPETRFVSIPAGTSRPVNLLPGTYKYAATAKNTNIISGYKHFGTNRTYLWDLSLN